MRVTPPLYRPIFQRALKTAWHHRELWPLAALAGLLGTGTILNDLLSQVRSLLISKQTLGDVSGFFVFFKVYFSNLVQATPANAVISCLIFLTLTLLFVCALVTAQHVILRTVHRAAAKKTPLSGRALLKEVLHPRFARLLVLNTFFKVLLLNLLLTSGLLLSSLHTSTVVADAFFGLVFMVTVTLLALALNILCVLSLIAVTRDNASATDALGEAWETLQAHPVVCLEMSILLFGLSFLFTAAYTSALLVSAVPFVWLFMTAFETGSVFILSVVSLFFALVLVTFTIAFGGFVTTFTYSAWTELAYKVMRGHKLSPRLHVHGKNLLAEFSRSH